MTRPTQIHWVAYPQVLQFVVLPQSLLTSLQAKRLEIRPWRQGAREWYHRRILCLYWVWHEKTKEGFAWTVNQGPDRNRPK